MFQMNLKWIKVRKYKERYLHIPYKKQVIAHCRKFSLQKTSAATRRLSETNARNQLRGQPEELCLKRCGITLAIEYWCTKPKQLH